MFLVTALHQPEETRLKREREEKLSSADSVLRVREAVVEEGEKEEEGEEEEKP